MFLCCGSKKEQIRVSPDVKKSKSDIKLNPTTQSSHSILINTTNENDESPNIETITSNHTEKKDSIDDGPPKMKAFMQDDYGERTRSVKKKAQVEADIIVEDGFELDSQNEEGLPNVVQSVSHNMNYTRKQVDAEPTAIPSHPFATYD
ncbi:hypothetical protein HDV02_002458 [Globomyces sp. JEL0801]|nr:hypothetical protein HDV02_002458 [Globomyces sp. JEL0801]